MTPERSGARTPVIVANRTCRHGGIVRKMVLLIGTACVISIVASSCSSSSNSTVSVAPATGSNERVEPVGFDRYEIASAIGEAAIATQAPTTTTPTTTPATTTPPSDTSPLSDATIPTTLPTPASAPTGEPVPVTPTALAPTAEPVAAPTATAAPSSALPPPTARVATQPKPKTANRPVVKPTVPSTNAPAIAPSNAPASTSNSTTGATVPVTRPVVPPKAAGFDGKIIRVGILSTTTHPIWGTIGKALRAGLEARVATINRRGGIAGKYRIELVFSDTNYDPSQTASLLNATKDNVVGYAQILGTPNVEAIEPLLKQNQMVASPASQEARWATSANLLPIGNNYQVQAINGISYFLEQSAANAPGVRPKVCAASVATSYGEAGNEGFRFAQEKLGFEAGPVVSVGPADANMAPFSAQLRNAGCAAVMVTVGPAQTLGLVVSGRQQGFSPRWIIMGASFSEKIIVPVTGPLFEQGAWVVGDGTQWGDATVNGMAAVRNELIAADHRFWTENPDVGLTYGYVQGRVIEAVLEKAVSLGDLSHPGLLTASRQLGTVDTLGLTSPIDYSQALRLANARTTIFAVDGSYQNAIKVLSRDYTSPTAQAYKK